MDYSLPPKTTNLIYKPFFVRGGQIYDPDKIKVFGF